MILKIKSFKRYCSASDVLNLYIYIEKRRVKKYIRGIGLTQVPDGIISKNGTPYHKKQDSPHHARVKKFRHPSAPAPDPFGAIFIFFENTL